MTTPLGDSNRNPAPIWFFGPAVAVAVAIAIIWMRHANTSYLSTTCVGLYREARTASDSARVDSTRPTRNGKITPQSGSCGGIRTSARWR